MKGAEKHKNAISNQQSAISNQQCIYCVIFKKLIIILCIPFKNILRFNFYKYPENFFTIIPIYSLEYLTISGKYYIYPLLFR